MNPSPTALMGIDLGTSGTKTVIVDVNGNLLANALYDYSINSPQPGWAEQNPETW
jgi:Sugar (pentulose and hexulose) kinases